MTVRLALFAALCALSCAAHSRSSFDSSPSPPRPPPVPGATADVRTARSSEAARSTRELLVAPLRYGAPLPQVEDRLDAVPPVPAPEVSPQNVAPSSFQLHNGLRVVVVERHAFPVAAATLGVDIGATEADDAGQRRAEVLGPTFLASGESFALSKGGCSAVACFVSARGRSERLAELFQQIANRTTGTALSRDEYERRLATASANFDSAGDPVGRNVRAMLFGKDHPYGAPATGKPPTWAQLDDFRRRALVPSASTLVVVGDVTIEAVRRAAATSFDPWNGAARPKSPSAHRPFQPSTHALAMCANGGNRMIGVGVAATGPALTHPDSAAFEVLAQLLGGGLDSALFHGVREDLGMAYSVGASVQWLGDTSMMTVRGSFDGADVLSGTRAILAAIAAVRDAEPPADEVDRAKGTALGAWRSKVSTDQGIADELAAAALVGLTPADALLWPNRVRAVTAREVSAAAQRYLVQSAVRIAFVGRPEFVGTALSLGLGAPAKTDFFGREVPSP